MGYIPSNYTFNPDYQPFTKAQQYYDQAASTSLPSIESLDRADARTRSRLNAESKGFEMGIKDSYAGKGRSNSGAMQGALRQNQGNYLRALSGGLAENANNFETQRLEGSKNLAQIGQGMGTVGTSMNEIGLGTGTLGLQEQTQKDTKDTNDKNFLSEILLGLSSGGLKGVLDGANTDYNNFAAQFLRAILGKAGLGDITVPNPGT